MAGPQRGDCLRQDSGVFLLKAEEFSLRFFHGGFQLLKILSRRGLHEQQDNSG
jgi:hypothetical protein